MEECLCRDKQVLTIFKVSDTLTLLRCIKCGGQIASWINNIHPIKEGLKVTPELNSDLV